MTTNSAQAAKPSRHFFIILLIGLHLVVCFAILHKNASHPKTNERLASSDSINYVGIANDFVAGNFTFDYVKTLPHRQPLYPALLAVATKMGHGNRFYLGAVNILLASASILLIYLLTLRLFQNRIAAGTVALALAANPFLDRQITARLLTEPLHLLLTICAIAAFLRYLQLNDGRWIYLCATFLGLDYLTRPNGLFMAVTALGTLGLADLIRYRDNPGSRPPFAVWLRSMIGIYLAAVLIFLVVSSASWIPRLIYYQSPFHHGYLENYMWVDTYAQAHVGSSYATYTWKDYLRTHTFSDAVSRLFHGLRNVYLRVPLTMERVPILFLLSIGGIYCAFRKATAEYRYLFLFLFLQMMPLVWTNLANPSARVPYGSTLPFELFFSGLFVSWLTGVPAVRAWVKFKNGGSLIQ
jgi:hypothetical protein